MFWTLCPFLQRVSIACNAAVQSPVLAEVELSVHLSVTHWHCQKDAS